MLEELLHEVELTRDQLARALATVNDDEGRVHNWRNYVPEYVKNAWDTFSFETRAIVYAMCKERADREEWD